MKDINNMNTKGIIWHLIKRHALLLSMTANVLMVLWYILTHTAKDFIAFVAK